MIAGDSDRLLDYVAYGGVRHRCRETSISANAYGAAPMIWCDNSH